MWNARNWYLDGFMRRTPALWASTPWSAKWIRAVLIEWIGYFRVREVELTSILHVNIAQKQNENSFHWKPKIPWVQQQWAILKLFCGAVFKTEHVCIAKFAVKLCMNVYTCEPYSLICTRCEVVTMPCQECSALSLTEVHWKLYMVIL